MSIQHRSRIRSVADYSDNLAVLGACCYPRDASPHSEFHNTCVGNGGLWQPLDGNSAGAFTCPDLGATGCCCACSYVDNFRGPGGMFQAWSPQSNTCVNQDNLVDAGFTFPCYQGGLQNNVTFCDCSDRGGVWAEGIDCSFYTAITGDAGVSYISYGAESLCTANGTREDVRWPGGCCNGITCDDACSANDCANIAVNSYGTSTCIDFYPFDYCSEAPQGYGHPYEDLQELYCEGCSGPGEVEGFLGGSRNFEPDPRASNVRVAKVPYGKMLETSYQGASKSIFKSSCNYLYKTLSTDTTTLMCTNETRDRCIKKEGMWAGFGSENQSIECSESVSSDIQNFIENKKEISSSVVASWNIGDMVLGLGRYVGTRIVKNSFNGSGSVCEGNPDTGYSKLYTPEDPDSPSGTYAILVANHDFNYRKISKVGWGYESANSKDNVTLSSDWDSITNHSHNRHLNLVKNIDRTYNGNRWSTWMIPSMNDIGFLEYQTKLEEFVNNTSSLDKTPHLKYIPLIRKENTFYWSSTFVHDVGMFSSYTPLAYCQSFGTKGMGVFSPRNVPNLVRLIMPIKIC